MGDTKFSTKVGHGLARVLGIQVDYCSSNGPTASKLTRGESVFSVASADGYTEDEPSSADWLREQLPNSREVVQYIAKLFPFTGWILRYNVQWLMGDLVAGITIGAVVVPQSMAYAKLAELPVEYGLYSSFMGVLIYWFFATSKDITIGVSDAVPCARERVLLTDISFASPSLSCPLLSETLFSRFSSIGLIFLRPWLPLP